MADLSSIEWLYNPYTGMQGSSWNYWWGCTRHSPACSNCYISRQPPLRINHLQFDKVDIGGRTEILMAPQRVLYYPLVKWANKPRMIFVNSLSDLWHGAVNLRYTAEMYAVMLLAPQHVFLTLTKRTRRMRNWLRDPRFCALVREAVLRIFPHIPKMDSGRVYRALVHCTPGQPLHLPAHIWTGTTVEDNAAADERIPLLLDPGIDSDGVRWLSGEPLTSEITDPLDLQGRLVSGQAVRWVVFGGESGPAAKATPLDTKPAPGLRPISLNNLARLIGQTRQAGAVPFVKQLGEPWAIEHAAASKVGRDMSEWPQHLRVRGYPLALAWHTLTVDPDNALARQALIDTTVPVRV